MLISGQGKVQFLPNAREVCAGAGDTICIDEKDFTATCDPVAQSWTAAWKWADRVAAEPLWNTREEYPPAAAIKEQYDEELNVLVRVFSTAQ
ncbi:hypothetical protein M514_02143 [Trichuris suis]|uniref:Uncharacterized protein n=1 Tax=Trichuris suis TaxID=68888 RepID=A0A085N9H6_9BILA|nr:hypothetical protein M513_02143 [Trichuris suis]KFD66122.1 hypothetical protein M514_02143 [Trichuris suis]